MLNICLREFIFEREGFNKGLGYWFCINLEENGYFKFINFNFCCSRSGYKLYFFVFI